LSERLYLEMNNQARAVGVHMLLLLLPTKESAYEEIAARSGGRLSQTYADLLRAETRVRGELLRFCRSHDLPVVDVRPALAASLRNGAAVYPVTTDGHPAPLGYDAIAAALAETRLSH
jgi:hypothetical protein